METRVYARLEVSGSNPGYHMHMYFVKKELYLSTLSIRACDDGWLAEILSWAPTN